MLCSPELQGLVPHGRSRPAESLSGWVGSCPGAGRPPTPRFRGGRAGRGGTAKGPVVGPSGSHLRRRGQNQRRGEGGHSSPLEAGGLYCHRPWAGASFPRVDRAASRTGPWASCFARGGDVRCGCPLDKVPAHPGPLDPWTRAGLHEGASLGCCRGGCSATCQAARAEGAALREVTCRAQAPGEDRCQPAATPSRCFLACPSVPLPGHQCH